MTNHQQQLIHPMLLRTLAPTHFINRVVIGDPVTTYDSSNEPVISFTPNGNLTNLAAYIEPITKPQENRTGTETIITNTWLIKIAGYYPTITELNNATDERGNIFNIISASVDAFNTQTNIICEKVN